MLYNATQPMRSPRIPKQVGRDGVARGSRAYSLMRDAAVGRLRTLAEPGRSVRFKRADVLKLAGVDLGD